MPCIEVGAANKSGFRRFQTRSPMLTLEVLTVCSGRCTGPVRTDACSMCHRPTESEPPVNTCSVSTCSVLVSVLVPKARIIKSGPCDVSVLRWVVYCLCALYSYLSSRPLTVVPLLSRGPEVLYKLLRLCAQHRAQMRTAYGPDKKVRIDARKGYHIVRYFDSSTSSYLSLVRLVII